MTFVGCGDAFGSGGRFNTCFHVETGDARFLLDCGASSLVALKRLGIDRDAIGLILITHFHADHVGGVPFLVLDAQFVAKRTRPLVIAGPPGLKEHYGRALEAAFPGASGMALGFELALVELTPGVAWQSGSGIEVLPLVVRHGEPVERFLGYRIAAEGKVLAYTGDSAWTEALVELGRGADLLIAECYMYDRPAPLHLDYRTLAAKLPAIGPKRLILTHMGEAMLARVGELPHEAAQDGLVVTV